MTDDTGHSLTLAQPARRIIALYGAYSELLLALDGADLLAARTVADAHLPELAHLPAIGTHMRPNVELVASLAPDLVLQLAGRQEASVQTEALRKLGIPVLSFRMNSFADMFSVLRTLGRLTGREALAEERIAGYERRLKALRQRTAGKARPTVFYEVRYPNLLAAGKGGIVDEILELAGGKNVVASPRKLVRVNEELVWQTDPDVYLVQEGPMNPSPGALTQREHFSGLRAVRLGHVRTVPEDMFARPGPRAIEAAEMLQQWLAGLGGENQ